MEVFTTLEVGIISNVEDMMRKERIMLYMKMIRESVGGEKLNDEH